jgi:prepilin-type N-terminal cleavage/methylation domain-containing protein
MKQIFRSRGTRGMTLVEMLIAMVVLTVLGSAIAAVMVNQVKSSASVQSMAMVQSDVNLAISLIRSDIMQTGYGSATDEMAAQTAGGGDLTMIGSNLGGGAGRWTITAEANGLTPNTMMVRRWTGSDANYNIVTGDSIKVISGVKQLIGYGKVSSITNIDSTHDQLTLAGSGVGAGKGSVVSQFAIGGQVVYTRDAATNRLLRNGQAFLDNVESFRVRYFWDKNGDGTIDSTGGETDDALVVNVSPSQWNSRPLLIGVAIVTVSPTQERVTVDGRANYTVWGNTTTISGTMGRRYRNFYSVYVQPRNIGG